MLLFCLIVCQRQPVYSFLSIAFVYLFFFLFWLLLAGEHCGSDDKAMAHTSSLWHTSVSGGCFLFHKKRIAMLCVLHNGFNHIFFLYHRIILISTKVYFTQPKPKTIILVLFFIVFFEFIGDV